MRTPSRRTSVVSASALAVALLLGACSAAPKVQTPADEAGSVVTGSGAPEGFEDYYAQVLEWEDCGSGFECTTARAPLSWQDPGSGDIELALKRLPASGERIGSLLTNPGGPGSSGIDFVDSAARSVFGEPLRESFDVVGFDPRGVAASSAVECFDDARKDESLSKAFPRTESGFEAYAQELRAWGEACAENTGELLGHVDTQSAARDMDMLRSALGDEQLHYLGYSYGTQLGATYAGLFPERAGRLVLDGAIDTRLSSDEVGAQQAVGFENALRAYVADCQAGASCPLTGDVDAGMAQVRDLLDRALENPLRTSGDRRVTQTLAFYGVALPLYSQGNWPLLTQALDEAINRGTGDTLLFLADFYNDRNPDGTFSSNSSEAFRAIGCLDDRGNPDPEFMAELAAETEAAAPTMGSFFTYGGLTCADWPYPAVEQEFDLTAAGAAPILVIGTTNDPATPFVWSEGLTEVLESAVLLTYEGEGHTAYGNSNQCVADVVESFLVDGTVPEEGIVC